MKISKNVFWVVSRLPQRRKKNLTPLVPLEPLRLKKFQQTLILTFEANHTLSRENETKIVKITHSALAAKNVYRV